MLIDRQGTLHRIVSPERIRARGTAMTAEDPLSQPGLDPKLLDELTRFEGLLTDLGALVVQALRPGLGREEFDAIVDRVCPDVPAEVRTWFAWHDGSNDDFADEGDAYVPNGLPLLSLADAIAESRHMTRTSGPDGSFDPEPGSTWSPTWLPLQQLNWWWIVADAAGGEDAPAPIHAVSLHVPRPWSEPYLPSITAMVRIWNRHLEAGEHNWDAQGRRWANRVSDPDYPLIM